MANAVCALIILQRTSKDPWRKPQSKTFPILLSYLWYEIHSSFKLACVFLDIGGTLQMAFCKLTKKWWWNWEHISETASLTEQSKHKVKPSANRGWPIKLDNHTQMQQSRLREKFSWTSTSLHTGEFNAMALNVPEVSLTIFVLIIMFVVLESYYVTMVIIFHMYVYHKALWIEWVEPQMIDITIASPSWHRVTPVGDMRLVHCLPE